jgi:hypothetical protein
MRSASARVLRAAPIDDRRLGRAALQGPDGTLDLRQPHHREASDDDADLQAGAYGDRDYDELDQSQQPGDGENREPQRPPQRLSGTSHGRHVSRRLQSI